MSYYCLPADYEKRTLDAYSVLNDRYASDQIIETYGNILLPDIGSGRHASKLPKINLKELSKYIRHSHRRSIQFNYTLNASCWGNLELQPRGVKRIIGFVASLIDCGVDRFTIAVPSVIELVKRHFLEQKVTASVIAQVDSINKVMAFKALGCDRINLDENMNRDFEFIEHASREVDTELIVNFLCVNNCPFEQYHYNVNAHGTSTKDGAAKDDYIKLRCAMQQLGNPLERIKAGWIRPEDVRSYASRGVKYFKIIGRKPIDYDLPRTVETYMKGNFRGNLQHLFECFSTPDDLGRVFYIDNQALDGFLDYFIKNKPDCRSDCRGCRHCRSYARKALRTNKSLAKKCLDHCQRELVKLIGS
ncbi:MAG: U32 family peptidase [Candidatus Saganbacteria bacterium]|nr:U32 family peptidase [Candidatus Saganbacteria bacterium]